jgi:ABC-type glycerol-3-phosphate transport system substrate-binding protein
MRSKRMKGLNKTKKMIAAGMLVLAGFGGGAAVMVATSASADESSATASRGDESPLTGDALDEVTAAVEAEYPGATIERAETDSDGVYEAHLTTADDEEVTVELDEAYTITGTETH